MTLPSRLPVALRNPDEYQYATFVEDRRPQFKIHRTVGLAHGAVSYRTTQTQYQVTMTANCAVYRRVDDEWRILYSFKRGATLRCLPWQKDPGPPEQRLAEDALRSIKIAVADLKRRLDRFALDPELADRINAECTAFTARVEGLFR